MEQEVKVKIIKQYDGLTIKEFLKTCHVGRPTIESIRVNKASFVNGKECNLETVIHENDVLMFKVDNSDNITPYESTIKIAYEDDDFLIINKDAGVLVHNDGSNSNKTLNNMVKYYYECSHQNFLVKPVHRLDIETSGLIIYVKNFLIGSYMDQLMESHTVERHYLALVKGNFEKNKLKGRIYYRIGKDRHNSKKYRVSSTGVDAVTHYKVIKQYDGYSLVNLHLETGRTHQIRVHMSAENHPLLGDILYGEKKNLIKRVALHSNYVKFINPLTNKVIEVECELPSDMKRLCN